MPYDVRMSRTIFVICTSIAAIAAVGLGYDDFVVKMLERIPPLVSVLIQALLAISVLIAMINGEWPRWRQ